MIKPALWMVYFYITKFKTMKKLLILSLFVVNTIAVNAQTKTNTTLTKEQKTGKTIWK